MDKEVIVCVCIYTYIYIYMQWNTTQLLKEKEWNFGIYSNRDELAGYYIKWNKSDGEANTVWFHLYVKSKKIQETSEYNKKYADSEIQRTN